MQLHLRGMLGVPIESRAPISRHADPVRYHFSDGAIRHRKRHIPAIVMAQNPVLPMMIVAVYVHEPRSIQIPAVSIEVLCVRPKLRPPQLADIMHTPPPSRGTDQASGAEYSQLVSSYIFQILYDHP
jgi:hypothetical protein